MDEILDSLDDILKAFDEALERAESDGTKCPDQIEKYRKRISRWKTECFEICRTITGQHPLEPVAGTKQEAELNEAFSKFRQVSDMLRTPFRYTQFAEGLTLGQSVDKTIRQGLTPKARKF